MTCFNFFQKGVKAGTIEVCAAVSIVRKMPDISHAMLTGIFFKVHFLESGLSRGDYPNYIFFECVNYPLSICSDGRQ